jgi:two-component system sensor histidine kinase KdpD
MSGNYNHPASAAHPRELMGADDPIARLETEFLALISHELRSPLTAIKGYAVTLRRHGRHLPPDERDAFLRAISDASDRLDVMISRLLELSQLEAGLVIPRLAAVNIIYLIREAINSAERRWGVEARGADGHRFIAPEQTDLPLVRADLRLQRQALDIVLENASMYSAPGSAIRVTARAENPMVIISVHDHGATIPPESLNRIFDRFYRADSRLTREQGGLGAGLAICKRIMELQGGNIWVESQPATGTVFSMSLPYFHPAINGAE